MITTNSNTNLCRLLLSAVATRFPIPVFINWNTEIEDDPYKVHMRKVKGVLDYLDALVNPNISSPVTTSDAENDLVLILDGFDIWLQLPPDVFIKRYYEIVDLANERLKQSLGSQGAQLMRDKQIYQSIIFGPDKVCFPDGPSRAACWAAPETTFDRWAFGPETDSHQDARFNRPRWLNSGTIMGPVKDVRELMRATHDRLVNKYTVDSDQFYFAEIWGEQEYSRMNISGTLPDPMTQSVWVWDSIDTGEGHYEAQPLGQPDIDPDQNTEYHIMIDSESRLFQTASFYHDWISWGHLNSASTGVSEQDILDASPPMSHIERRDEEIPTDAGLTYSSMDATEVPPKLAWADLLLGYNMASHRTWGLIHFTPPKEFLDRWWFRMWFAPYAEAIIKHGQTVDQGTPYTSTRDNRTWYSAVPNAANGQFSSLTAGGAMADTGEWMDWPQLCGEIEDFVFANHPNELF
ncbi:MAG: hypothetical protein Q9162_002068 [Coniocarpon cinnabarinum]